MTEPRTRLPYPVATPPARIYAMHEFIAVMNTLTNLQRGTRDPNQALLDLQGNLHIDVTGTAPADRPALTINLLLVLRQQVVSRDLQAAILAGAWHLARAVGLDTARLEVPHA